MVKKLLKTGGYLYLVYPAGRLGELFCEMENNNIKSYALKTVYSKEGSDGELVLVAGKKGYKGHLKVLSPLYVYEDDGSYSREISDLFEKGVLKW